jgi:hypothetical protein
MKVKVMNSRKTVSPGTKAVFIISSLKTRQSMEYHHKSSFTSTKEIQDCSFYWHSHAHCLWDTDGAVYSKFTPTGTTINCKCYDGMLLNLKAGI